MIKCYGFEFRYDFCTKFEISLYVLSLMVHLFGMKTIIQVAALRDHEKRLREADAERDHQISSVRFLILRKWTRKI